MSYHYIVTHHYYIGLAANMVCPTGRNEKRVREDIESECGFLYWKNLNTGTFFRAEATAYLVYLVEICRT